MATAKGLPPTTPPASRAALLSLEERGFAYVALVTLIPDAPAPAPVTLSARSTAVLVLDLTDYACARTPAAEASLPTARALVDRARDAGAGVIFTLGRATQVVHAAMARRESEPVVKTSADKFFGTELERLLDGKRFVVALGTAANGAVVYTSFAACARGLTVVVAVDAIASRTEVATAVATWQLLNQPGFANPDNTPLAPGLVTLSRTDLIRFEI